MFQPIKNLESLIEDSFLRPIVIFKHSTRCSISDIAYNRMLKHGATEGVDYYLVNVITERALSNEISSRFQEIHESPQVLIIKNGECVFAESHLSIQPAELDLS